MIKTTRQFLYFLGISLTLCSIDLNSKENEYADFQSVLDSSSLVFTNNKSYKRVARIKQEDVDYHYAFRKEGYDGEIRISVFPSSESYEDEPSNHQLFMMSTEVVMLNIQQPKNGELSGKFNMFPFEGVKTEFGADYGMSGLIEGNSSFSKGFKYIHVIGLWKKKVGFAYIFILFNDIKKAIPFPLDLFYSLRFRE